MIPTPSSIDVERAVVAGHADHRETAGLVGQVGRHERDVEGRGDVLDDVLHDLGDGPRPVEAADDPLQALRAGPRGRPCRAARPSARRRSRRRPRSTACIAVALRRVTDDADQEVDRVDVERRVARHDGVLDQRGPPMHDGARSRRSAKPGVRAA